MAHLPVQRRIRFRSRPPLLRMMATSYSVIEDSESGGRTEEQSAGHSTSGGILQGGNILGKHSKNSLSSIRALQHATDVKDDIQLNVRVYLLKCLRISTRTIPVLNMNTVPLVPLLPIPHMVFEGRCMYLRILQRMRYLLRKAGLLMPREATRDGQGQPERFSRTPQ